MILWDAATGTETSRLAGPAGAYSSPTFSPDGRLVAALGIREGSPNWVTVWDVASTTERLSFEPAGEPFSVTFHPDGQTLVVPGWTSNRVGFYSADDGREVDSLSTPGFEPVGAAIDSTGTWLALPSETSGGLQVWNLKTRKLLHTISAVFVQVVDWSPDGERLAMSNGNQGPIQVVDVESGQVVMMLRGHVTAPGVAFVGDGDRLVSVGGVEGDLRVWNVSRNGPPALGAITALVDGPFGFELSPDGAQVATITGRGGGAVEILGADSGELLRPPLTDAGWVVLSPDWRLVASLRSDAQGEIHDLRTSALVGELPACTRPKAFSPDGSLLLLDGRAVCTPTEVAPQLIDPPVGADLRNRVIDVVTGEEILDLGEQVVDGSAFNPEGRFPGGRYLALTVHGTVVEIYDVVNRELVTSLEAPTVLGVTFDPTGRWLAGGGWDGRVWVLDFAAVVNGMDPEEALVFDQVATNGVSRFALNGDGILATSGNGDGLLRLWNFQNGELLREFRTDRVDGPAIGHGAMQFSPDGSYMLYMDSAGVLRRYLLDTDELIALAETRLTRNFTVDECRRYLDSTECQ
jgi:WD40 repeat protein